MKFRSILLVTLSCSTVLAVQFIFTPSPNIEVYQLAHYQCSVDHTGVSIAWFVNETASNNYTIKLGIVTNGIGSNNSSFTIPGYPQYNNTVVTCFAGGLVNNSLYNNFDNATLRIQGELAAVNNFICHVQSQYINCSWSPPFSLVSIPGYIINVTYGGELVTQNTTSSTTWQYCPSQFGTYTISVAGNSSAGEGEITITSVEVPENYITHCDVTPIELLNGTYLVKYDIQTLYSLPPLLLSVNVTSINGTIIEFNKNVDNIDNNKFKGNINVGTTGRQKLNITLVLRYNCSSLTSQMKTLTTFDVQNGSLTVMDSTIGQVCFTCYFLVGSQSQGCYIEYKCIDTDYNGNITIERKPVNTNNASNCAKGVFTGNYNVTFYDLDDSSESYLNEYALKLTNQIVSGLPVPIRTSTSYTYLTTLTTLSSSLSPPSPIVLCTNCTISKTLCQNPINNACTFTTTVNNSLSLVTVSIVVPVLVFFVFIIMLIMFIAFVILSKLKSIKTQNSKAQEDTGNSSKEKGSHDTEISSKTTQLNLINYTDVTPSSNGPIAPPTLHSTVPYSTVVHETPIMEQYSLVQQYQSSYLVNGPSNEEYARLNHNVHASIQLYDCTQHPHSHTSTPIPPMYSTLPTNGNMTSYISSPDSQYSTLSNKTSDKLTIKKTIELTHKDLVTYVAPHVTTKLREIGTALVLTPSELDDIEENHQGITGMFQLWYETKRRPYNWDTLLMILRSPAVNNAELADQLEIQVVQ